MLRTGLKFAANGDAAASLLADIFNENRHRPRAVVDIEKQRAVEVPKTEAPTPDLSQLDDIRGALAGQYDAPIRLDPMPAPEPAMKVEAALLAAAQEELAAAQEALAAAEAKQQRLQRKLGRKLFQLRLVFSWQIPQVIHPHTRTCIHSCNCRRRTHIHI